MWRYHICAATVFSLNELAHECKRFICDWRASLKNAFVQDSVFVNQHNQNFRFEFPTTSGSEWISISRSSQTNTTTSWGKAKLFRNFFWLVFPFSPVPRTYRELGMSKNDSKGEVDGWRRSMFLLVALSLKKKRKTPFRLIVLHDLSLQ